MAAFKVMEACYFQYPASDSEAVVLRVCPVEEAESYSLGKYGSTNPGYRCSLGSQGPDATAFKTFRAYLKAEHKIAAPTVKGENDNEADFDFVNLSESKIDGKEITIGGRLSEEGIFLRPHEGIMRVTETLSYLEARRQEREDARNPAPAGRRTSSRK